MEDIRDIKGVVPLLDKHQLLWVALAVAALGALLGTLAYFYIRRRLKRKTVLLSPYDEAFQALEACKGLLESGDELADHTLSLQLSFILRRYLERTLNLPLMESTTQECQELLAQLENPQYQASYLDTLERCDLLKFARHQLSVVERKKLFSEAQELLRI